MATRASRTREPLGALAALGGLCLAAACETREGLARRDGEQARAEVAALCSARIREEAAACVEEGCAEPCAQHTGVAARGACLSACTGLGDCATDSDCAAGLGCVAIAPRVRRCSPVPAGRRAPDGGAEPGLPTDTPREPSAR